MFLTAQELDRIVEFDMAKINGSGTRLRRGKKRFRVLALDQLRGLQIVDRNTNGCGIYFLWGLSELLYIGQSNDVSYRLHQHRKSKNFTHMTFEPIAEECLRHCEQEYVLRYRPRYNRTRLG